MILFGSTNKGKVAEIRQIATKYSVDIITPIEFREQKQKEKGFVWPAVPDVEEGKDTYSGNAREKALAFHEWSGMPSLADDTGLEVELLGGAPGVYSARYSGPSATAQQNIAKLLSTLSELDPHGQAKPWKARFVCELVLVTREREFTARGVLPGEIVPLQTGQGGFGYDSVFRVAGREKTLAEIKEVDLDITTHRLAAMEAMMLQIQGQELGTSKNHG